MCKRLRQAAQLAFGILSVAAHFAYALPDPATEQRALVNQYCVGCHNERLKTAGLMLDRAALENPGSASELWEKVLLKVRSGQMPPAGMPRPDQAASKSFAGFLATELDRAAEARPNPGRSASVRRLNRAEYANAIRDLLALEIASEHLLPADDASHGFDNVADALSVSPLLLERYMSAAEVISRLAVGDPTIPAALETYDASESESDNLPLGSGDGIAVWHFFPLDGHYTFKVEALQGPGGENAPLDLRIDGAVIGRFVVDGGDEAEILELRIPVKAGPRLVSVSLPRDSMKPEGAARNAGGVESITVGGPFDVEGLGDTPSRRKIFVCRPPKSATIADEESCATRILNMLTRIAYRRFVSDQDTRPLLNLYRTGRSKADFETGIRAALEAMLVSPGFLFRLETDPADAPPETPYRISDVELASRLSFFLWSSIPDDELLGLAEQGKLKDREVQEQQVRRMLSDPRARALVDNFGGQWLHLRRMASKQVDRATFADFDEALRQAFQQETELFFQSILREDRSVLDLLSADYTFVNERLAQHYGIPGIYGPFRRVVLSDANRRGLLGKGSLLTVTSYNTRTSPVLRGQWLLQNILGTPPPPPPPDVPALGEDDGGNKLTMRERMAEHRANPSCASCHNVMDPLGLALENFDAIGQWRTQEAGGPIDVSGKLPDGTMFDGPNGLREVLLRDPDRFVETLTEKLLIYALGRGATYDDRPAIRKILRDAAPDYRWSSLVTGIVNSTPFQMRRSAEP